MKILCCADIHMGRIPSLAHSEELFGYSAWKAIVDKAIELNVDVLTLSGDVVEQQEHWFEAYGPLLSGLDKLGKAGIQVIGVGGNHDYSVLPSLARESPHIKILGLGGVWESFDYMDVRFIGWSFAERWVQANPLESFDKALADTDLPLLGLLHCDVGSSPSSNYAPVSLADFSRSPIPLWALGHIHKGESMKGGSAFYCGSPYALDSNEEGEHGIWLLEKSEGGRWKDPLLLPLCPYRFERVEVSLEGAKDEEDVRKALTQALQRFALTLAHRGTLYCSLILVGTISRLLDIKAIITEEKLEALWFQVGFWKVRPLARYDDRTHLDIDLHQLAKGTSATALLAKKLLDPLAIQTMAEQYKSLERESFTASVFQHLLQETSSKTKKENEDEYEEENEEEYRTLATEAAKRLLFAMITSEQGGTR